LQGRYTPADNKNTILSHKKYTVIPPIQYTEENIDLYREIVRVFKSAVEERLMSDRPIGCLLSGGLDSSLVASIAASLLKEKGQRLRTFSIGMKEGTDIVFAREVAKHIDSDHTEFIYEPEEGLNSLNDVIEVTETFDITTIRASVGQYLIAKRIAETTDVKVVLNGDGADECQMGYLYFYLAPNAEEAKKDRDRLVQ
jgi:asparagine synthase (glutamine-hydrolysing)